MVLKDDYGNLGNLVAYLNGKDLLEERIKKADKIFFIPLNVPPQHKEEVVILWLADILSTNKALTYSAVEVKLVWKSLRKFLSSKRLKALCSYHWVCPFTSSFIQTLVTTVSETTTASDIREEALLICECLFNSPSLSPQVGQLSNQSLSLCTSMLVWANKGNLCPTLFSFLTLLLQRSLYILNNRVSKINAVITVYDRILLPSLKLSITLQRNPNSEAKTLLCEIKTFVMSTLFSSESGNLYGTLLELTLEKESKEQLSRQGESFYGFLINCIKNNDKDVAAYILREFTICFFQSYKEDGVICYQFLINVMYLLGISLKEGPSVEENSIAAQTLSPAQLEKACKEKFIAAVLEALQQTNINMNQILSKIPLKKWIENLGKHLLTEKKLTEDTLRCLILIVKLNPMCVTNIQTLFSDLLVCSRATDESYLLLDNILCEILDTHVKLRTIDTMYEKLSESLSTLNNSDISNKKSLLHEAWFTYERKHVLPSNFMRRFLSSIKKMGTQMWLSLWSAIHRVLSKTCHNALQKETDAESVSSIALTVWLSSCCLSATSILEAVSISGMAVKVSHSMNTLAEECIEPLIKDILTLKEGKSSLCHSLLNLILVWSELHITLLSTETGYKDETKYPPKPVWECVSMKDFSSQIPFLKNEIWSQILTTCLDEHEDVSRFWVLQLVIQKVSLIEVQRIESEVRDVRLKNSFLTSLSNECLSYIFWVDDTMKYPLSTDLVAFHLPSLIPLLKTPHLNATARMFVAGIEEEREPWIKFGKSCFFQDCKGLQSMVFSLVCNKLLSLLTGGKRKLDEEDLDEIGLGSKPKYLIQKVLMTLIKKQEKKNQRKKTELAKEKFCFSVIVSLLNSEKRRRRSRLAKRSQKEVLSLLRVLDQFPIPLLTLKPLMDISMFILIVMIEEGGLNGRRDVICRVLRLLNQIVVSPYATKVFKHSKAKPFFILPWLVKESEKVLEDFSVEDSYLRIILENEEPPEAAVAFNPLGELLHLINSLTELFLAWNETGTKIISYSKTLVEVGKSTKTNEMYPLAALMLVFHFRKRFESSRSKMNLYLVEALETLVQWSLEVSEGVELSEVTNITLANCLSVFTSVLFVKREMNITNQNQEKKGTENKSDEQENSRHISEEHINTVETVEGKVKNENKLSMREFAIDWKTLISNGVRLADLASDTENIQLKKLCLDFFVVVAASSKEFSSVEVWDTFQRAWRIVSFGEKFSNHTIKALCGTLSSKHYRLLLETLLEETRENPFNGSKLFQWLTIITTDPPTIYLLQTKSTAIEQLIIVLCIHINNEAFNQSDFSVINRLLKVFVAVLETKSNVSVHSKSLLLNAIVMIPLNRWSNTSFMKVFEEMAKLLSTFIGNEYHLVSNRPSSIISAITHLALSMMHEANRQQNFDETTIKDLGKCCDELEKIVKSLKKYDVHFFKLLPFSLAKIVEKMQQTKLLSPVKESMERVVYSLLDLSDDYSLRHLLVTISPSVITLLKHLHFTFTDNYRFNPRTA